MKMKRKIKSSVALLLSIALLATNGGFSTIDSVKAASSSTATDLDCWDYTIDGDNVILSKIKQLDADDSITVSSTYTLDDETYKTVIDSTDNVCSPFYKSSYDPSIGQFVTISPKKITIADGIRLKDNNASHLFDGCSQVSELNIAPFDFNTITDASYMFNGCSTLQKIIGADIDTFSNIENASFMFSGCVNLDSFTSYDFSSVKTADYMFADTNVVDFDCSIIPNATNIAGLLSGCTNLSSFSFGKLNLTTVNSLNSFVSGSSIKSIDLSDYDLSNIEDLSYFASYCKNLTIFKIGNTKIYPTNVSGMLAGCTSLADADLSSITGAELRGTNSILEGAEALQKLKTPACKIELPVPMITESGDTVNSTDGSVQILTRSSEKEITITFELDNSTYEVKGDKKIKAIACSSFSEFPSISKIMVGSEPQIQSFNSEADWKVAHDEWLAKQYPDLEFLGWFDSNGKRVDKITDVATKKDTIENTSEDSNWIVPDADCTLVGHLKDPTTKITCTVNRYIEDENGTITNDGKTFSLYDVDTKDCYIGDKFSPSAEKINGYITPDQQSLTVTESNTTVNYYYVKQKMVTEVYADFQDVNGNFGTLAEKKIGEISGYTQGEELPFEFSATNEFEAVSTTLVNDGEKKVLQIPRKKVSLEITRGEGVSSLHIGSGWEDQGTFTYYIGYKVSVAAVISPGYEFTGWSNGEKNAEFEFIVDGAVSTLSTSTKLIKYSVMYDFEDVSGNSLSCDTPDLPDHYYVNENITIPTPNIVDYDFIGWRETGSEYLFDSYTILQGRTEDIHLTAVFKAKPFNYTVNRYLMNSDCETYEKVSTISVSAEELINIEQAKPSDDDVLYYDFSHYETSSGEKISSLDQVGSDHILNLYYDRKQYNVTMQDDTHLKTSLNSTKFYWGQTFSGACKSTDDSYEFQYIACQENGEISESSNFSFVMPSCDITLVSYEQLCSCTVTFDSQTNGGSDDNLSITELCTNEIALGDYSSSKDGYEFIGWNTNPNATKALDTVTAIGKSMTLYAIFKKQVVINVVTADGSDQKVTTAYNNAELPAVEFSEFEKDFEDHKFIGWTTTDSLSEGSLDSIGKLSGVEDGSTIYAVYGDEIISHFVINDREVKDCKSGKYYHSLDLSSPLISSVTSPEVDDSEWTFKGFSLDSDSAEINVLPGQTITPVKSETYYAVFEKEYSVEYSNVTDTVIAQRIGAGAQSIDEYHLREFTGSADTGYKFTGWIIGDEKYQPGSLFSPNTLVTTVETSLEPISYEIRFSNEDCNGQMQSVFAKYNEDITLPHCTLSKDGYSFIGWSLDQSSKVSLLDGAICKNLSDTNDAAVTLYPVWQKVNQVSPSVSPSASPSASPSISPSASSSTIPSATPSVSPSVIPSVSPSVLPSVSPSVIPSVSPSVLPSVTPSVKPSAAPSIEPSSTPSAIPSVTPSVKPSSTPSVLPSVTPSSTPDNAQYFIQFNANGGVGVMHLMQLGMNEKAALPECGFANDSKYFIGWALSPNGTAVYKDREIILSLTSVANSVVNLFAVWGDNTPVVSPSATPSILPSSTPSIMPTLTPSDIPTAGPTNSPVAEPSIKPIMTPTVVPTKRPDLIITTDVPTQTPIATTEPTIVPNTNAPAASEPVRTPDQVTPIEIPTVSPKSNVIQGIRNVPSSAPAEDPGEQDVKKVSSKSLIGSTVCVSNCNYTILSNSTCALAGRTDSVSALVVSKTVIISGKRYKITQISDDAFSGSMLKSVTIGNNVQKIGKRSFKNCKSLKKVKLGKSVKTISQNAFSGCSALKTIKITSRMIISVKKNAFNGVNSKIVIDVPDGMQKYYKKLFTKSGLSKKVKFV